MGEWGRVLRALVFCFRMDPAATAAWLSSVLSRRFRRSPA
jgi:hypothetical protein